MPLTNVWTPDQTGEWVRTTAAAMERVFPHGASANSHFFRCYNCFQYVTYINTVGKDWWESVVILTTTDDSLTRTDIDYLESVLIEKAFLAIWIHHMDVTEVSPETGDSGFEIRD